MNWIVNNLNQYNTNYVLGVDYFKTKPFQPDYEEFFEEEKQDQVWFETIINKELVQQLLSYGMDVEVLEPESLKKQMTEHSKSMKQFYEE